MKMDDISKSIDANKEILSAMPQNNEKNIEIYVDKIEKIEKEYSKYKEEILIEIKRRYDTIKKIKKEESIPTLEKEISKIEKILALLNDEKTSYEKMELDKIIYKLGKFYKSNLEVVNEQILKAIKIFNQVGIRLKPNDFEYSSYAKEYMESFFSKSNADNVNTQEIKEKFEEIYWQCPELIIHIELNLRFLYLKNESAIDRYYTRQKENTLKNLTMSQTELLDKYFELKEKLANKKSKSKYLIMQDFLNGNKKITDFAQENIEKSAEKILPGVKFKALSASEKEELNINVNKFLNSLYEYRNYLKFKFVYDNIKKKYQEKDNFKNIYSKTKKELEVEEKKLQKLNSKMSGRGFFFKKKKTEKQTAEYTEQIFKLKDKYRELDLNKIQEKIYEEMTDTTTIFDVLNFACSFHNYITKCIIEQFKDITQDEIEEMVCELDKFLKSPNHTIISNITILENKDIALIIKDRYKLLGFEVEKDDVEESNLNNMINILENLKFNFDIEKSGLEVKKIKEFLDYNEILKTIQ